MMEVTCIAWIVYRHWYFCITSILIGLPSLCLLVFFASNHVIFYRKTLYNYAIGFNSILINKFYLQRGEKIILRFHYQQLISQIGNIC
mgnify:FL=1